jgi:phospholipid/cholesterol/gamma-HCH transport system ATP-binding protein
MADTPHFEPQRASATSASGSAVADAGAQPVVLFENVTVSFAGPPVLQDISFQVGPNETRILIGPAGVGKSVLLKVVNGLIRPDSGSVFLFGEDITRMDEKQLLKLRIRTGMVFQESALFDSLNVRDNVGYQLMERHVAVDEVDRRVHEALRFVELDHTYEMFPPSLSGGMRRRVAIARAIIDQPALLLYDSPTGGLDPVTSSTINELIIKERDVYGTPSLLVTHRLQDAFTMATHRYDTSRGQMVPLPQGQPNPLTNFLVLHQGRLIFDGSTEDLVTSKDPFIQEFIA